MDFGTTYKLSGKRRKPWAVRKTVGYNEKHQPIYKFLGFYETQAEAKMALAEFNRNPYDLSGSALTFSQVYGIWREHPFLADATVRGLESMYNLHCKSLYNLKYRDIKPYIVQEIINQLTPANQRGMKALIHNLDKIALEREIVLKGISDMLRVEPIIPKEKEPFTDEELQVLWANLNNPYAVDSLIMCYSGFRISEFLSLEVDIESMTFKGGVKTKAGKNRIVPIHSRIQPIVSARMEAYNKLNYKNASEAVYRKAWIREVERLIENRKTPHDCRHTFRSRLDSAGAKSTAIDLMMGHKSQNVGERVYTHKSIEELRAELEKMC